MEGLYENVQKDLESTSELTATERAALQKIRELGKKTNIPFQQQIQQAKAIIDGLTATEKVHIIKFIHSELPGQPLSSPTTPKP